MPLSRAGAAPGGRNPEGRGSFRSWRRRACSRAPSTLRATLLANPENSSRPLNTCNITHGAGGRVSHPFIPFGPSHLTAIALALLVPLALALLARHEHLGRHADRIARVALAALLALGW